MTLREQVEVILPKWESWYANPFDATVDLGLLRAEVCDPDSLNLNKRHSRIRQQADNFQNELWGGSND